MFSHKRKNIKLSIKTGVIHLKVKYFTCLIVLLFACYPAPKIKGFDRKKWMHDLVECDDYRTVKGAPLLINQKEIILGSNQNEIIALLGSPTKQRLDKRNRKFFFYQLNCKNTIELSIRFNAIGAAKEVFILK
tara:strand:- start:1430 stop:1828 length:399 start_codon:yes stop_codon:yes gene_type:complete